MFLTSPYIDQALAQACAVSSPNSASNACNHQFVLQTQRFSDPRVQSYSTNLISQTAGSTSFFLKKS